MQHPGRRFSLQFLLVFLILYPSVLSAQSVLQYPRVIAESGLTTGITAANPTTAEASVTFTAYQEDGSLLAGTGVKNPVTVVIPAAGQLAKSVSELFGVDTFNGWVQATSSSSGVTGFFLNFNPIFTDLDGAGSTNASSDILIPLAAEDAFVQTEITIVNVNPETASATATLYSQAGTVLQTKQVSLASHALVRRTLSKLFGTSDFSSASHMRVRSDRPVIAHEVVVDFLLPGSSQRRESAALTGHDPSGQANSVLPQFASGGGWISLIGLVNGSGISQDVTITAYKDDGTPATGTSNPKTITLAGNGALRTTASELLGISDTTMTTGWIKVSSTLGYVTSYIGYGNVGSPSFAMVEGTPSGSATLNGVFAQVAEGGGYYTGLTVVNPGTESANVEFYTIRADGSTVGKVTLTVAPNQHSAKLFREFLPASLGQIGGWGYLRSSKPVVAAVLFGTTNGYALANVPQQIPASDFVPPTQTSASITGTVRFQESGLLKPLAGVDVQLAGPTNTTRTTDDSGRFVFSQLAAGTYTLTPTKGSQLMLPVSKSVTLATTNIDNVDFEAQGETDAPKPAVFFVTPSTAFKGTTTLNIRVLGGNFTKFSEVRLNGQTLTTQFVSSVELTASVPGTLLSSSDTKKISVYTPPKGGGESTALDFAVTNPPNNPLITGFVTVGGAPAGVAIDEARHRALVSNESDDTVSVIDLATRTVIKEIPVGRSPAEGIAIHPGLNYAAVANVGSNDVSIIDLNTLEEKQKIVVGRQPVGVAINASTNRLYVVNSLDNNMTTIDLDKLTKIESVTPTGNKPFNIAVNPKTNQAVITNRDDNSVTLLNLTNNSLLTTLSSKMGTSPRGVAYNTDTDVAVVVSAGSNTATLIDMSTRSVIGNPIAVGSAPTGVAIHRGTNNAIITNSAATKAGTSGASITILNLDDKSALATIDQLGNKGAFGVSVDESLQTAVIAEFFGNDAMVINVPNPQPKVEDIEPKTFPVGGGSIIITVKGKGFVPTSVVTLNGQSLPTQFISSTELRATVSGALLDTIFGVSQISTGDGKPTIFRAGAPSLDFGVSNPCPPCGTAGGGSSNNQNNPNTKVAPQNPAPALFSLSLQEITVGSNLSLTLNGNNFNATSLVNFGALHPLPGAVSLTAITIDVPASQLTPGDVPVSVTNPTPGGGTTQVLTFKITPPPNPAPTITTVTPSSINAGSSATTVTIVGTGFITSTTGALNGVAGVRSGNAMTFALPASMLLNAGTLSGFVSNPSPGGGSTSISVNVVSVVPTITNFTPRSVDAGSESATITVDGTNFRNNTIVTIGETPIPTTFVSSTRVTGVIPASYLRRNADYPLGVTTPAPGGGSAAGGTFSVVSPLPILTSLTPAKATRQTTSFAVTLNGSGFTANSAVFVGGTTRLDAFFSSSTLMTTTIPATLMNTPGPLNFTVTNPAPAGGTSAPQTFTIENPTAVITDVSPNKIDGGSTNPVLTITGTGFVNGAAVQLGTTALVTTFVSSTKLTAVIPSPLAPGLFDVTVLNPTPSTVSNKIQIEITALKPVVENVATAPFRPGSQIKITGRNFGPNSLVLLRGGIIASGYVDTKTMLATIPTSASLGSNQLTVLNPALVTNGTAQLSDPFSLDIVSPIPAIESISPSSGTTGNTVTIDVTGTSFFENAVVVLGPTILQTTYIDFSHLRATAILPAAGGYSVRVQNTGGFQSNGIPFIVNPVIVIPPNPLPTITSIFPTNALINSSTLTLNVSGTGFISSTTLSFGGTPLVINSRSATSLSATLPASLMTTGGIRPVVVNTPAPGGGSATTSFTVTTVQMSPSQAEKTLNTTLQFNLINPPTGTFIWSVSIFDGGNSTYGTVTNTGLYTAPASVPSPSTFPVCARLSTNANVSACAQVTVSPSPSPGQDLVVINDTNAFDDTGTALADNRLLVRNLVTFTAIGSRNSGTVVQFDCGRNSLFPTACSYSGTQGEIIAAGMTVNRVDSSTVSRITSIPANVKVLFLWMPQQPYSIAEINVLKDFAANGGRLVYIGENFTVYGPPSPGIDIENDLLAKMGSGTKSSPDIYAAGDGFVTLPVTSLRAHQITTGMTGVKVAGTGVLFLGANDIPLIYDINNALLIAAVAKVDTTPLPTGLPTVTSVTPNSGKVLLGTPVVINGTNFIKGSTTTLGTFISFTDATMAVSNVSVINTTTINATLTPNFNTLTGGKVVIATTPNGTSSGGPTFNVIAANPPSITSLTPGVGVRPASGNNVVNVTINGSNFMSVASIVVSPSNGVTAGTPTVLSGTTMMVQLTVTSAAPIGPRSIQVTTAGGTSGTLSFTVLDSNAFTGFSKVWVGGTAGATNDWETASNWNPAGVPITPDNVFIPGGLDFNPVLSNHRSLNDLYLAPGATLTVASGKNLTAGGNVYAGDSIDGFGIVVMTGTGKKVGGKMYYLFIQGSVSAMANVTVMGDMFVLGTGASSFTVNGFNIGVVGNFSTTNQGVLVMTNPNDYIQVGGTTNFLGGSETGKLTAGAMELKGHFSQGIGGGANDSFVATGTHITRFVGSGMQNVSMTNPTTSSFGKVEVANASGGAVNVPSGQTAVTSGDLVFTTATALLTGPGTFKVGGNLPGLPTGAQLTVASLHVAGNVVNSTVPIGSTTSVLTMSGTNNTVVGTILGHVTITGNIKASGATTIGKTLTISNSGSFDPNGFVIDIGQDLFTLNFGVLKMSHGSDQINVTFNISFAGGSTSDYLTDGLITVRGNFFQVSNTAFDSFAASGSHKVRFVGSGFQTISIEHPTASRSHFQNVEIANLAGGEVSVPTTKSSLAMGNVAFTTNDAKLSGAGSFVVTGSLSKFVTATITITTIKVGGNFDTPGTTGANQVYLTGTGNVGGVFTGNIIILGNYSAGAGVTANSITVDNGSFTLNGKIVTTTGDFNTSGSGGTVTMNNDFDRLNVGNHANFQGGSTAGKLTNGQIALSKDLYLGCSNSSSVFSASGNHLTRFVGTVAELVTMGCAGPTQSHFQDVEIATSGAAGRVNINQGSQALALGYLKLNSGKLYGIDTDSSLEANTFSSNGTGNIVGSSVKLVIGGGLDASSVELQLLGPVKVKGGNIQGYFYNDLEIAGNVTLTGDVNVSDGDVTVTSGSLDLNGHHLYTGLDEGSEPSNFSTSATGILIMQHETDQLVVDGNVSFGGGSTDGKLTTGEIRVGGNFTQTTGSLGQENTFAASGNHKVTFTGETSHHAWFDTPGKQGSKSHFQTLNIQTEESDFNALLLGTDGIQVNGQLVAHHHTKIMGDGRTLNVTGLDVDGLFVDRVLLVSDGGTLTSFNNVTFDDYNGADNYLTIFHPGTANILVFNGLNFLNSPDFGEGHYIVVKDSLLNELYLVIRIQNSNISPFTVINSSLELEGADGADLIGPPE